MRYMYDASIPPLEPPHWYACAGYIGGDTPHVWTKAEWDAQPTVKRLPIWTAAGRPDTEQAGQEDGGNILHALRDLGVPAGVTVALDMETEVKPIYAETVGYALAINSYHLLVYGSFSYVTKYPTIFPSLWAADWSDSEQEAVDQAEGRIVAVQWRSAEEIGREFDMSLIEQTVPLW